MRPSPNTSIFAPTRCGVDPVVDTIVTSAADSPRSSASATAANTSWFIWRDYDTPPSKALPPRSKALHHGGHGVNGGSALYAQDFSSASTVSSVVEICHRCRSHATVGSVPAINASLNGLGQPGVASLPLVGSMSMKTMPSGTSKGTLARPGSAAFMYWVQIGNAACAPERPTGWLSSKPTQTTVSSSGVKPTNQASRRSLVVPDLPAASSANPAARAPAPVPSLMTLRIMLVTRKVVSGRATRLSFGGAGLSVRVPSRT